MHDSATWLGNTREKAYSKRGGVKFKTKLILEKALTNQSVCDVTGFQNQYHNKLFKMCYSVLSSLTRFDTYNLILKIWYVNL